MKPITILSKVDEFFFGADPERQVLRIFRFALGIQMWIVLVLSLPNWQRFYGEPPISAHHYVNLFSLATSPLLLFGLWGIGVAACGGLILGVHTRLSAFFLFILQRSMVMQSPMLVNGHDYVFSMLLFCAMWMPLASATSSRPGIFDSIWARRVAQLLFTLMYIGTGVGKILDEPKWIDGSALAWVAFSDRWSTFVGNPLFAHPLRSAFFTYATLIIEILAPLSLWFLPFRVTTFLAVCSLHVGIILTMDSGIALFNTGTITWALLFLKDTDVARIPSRLAAFCRERAREPVKR